MGIHKSCCKCFFPQKNETTAPQEYPFSIITTDPLEPLSHRSNQEENSSSNSLRTFHKFESKISSRMSCDDIFFGIDKAVIIGHGFGTPQGNYEFGKKLGEGSYGSVFLVKHRQTGDLRAIKVLRKAQGKMKEKINQEIINEIEMLKKIDHQNILKIFEFYESDSAYFLVTEFCKGGELFDKVQNEGPMNEVNAGIIMFQLFSAINYCHMSSIVHRDLKPENILLEEKLVNGFTRIRLIDFGTAKILEKFSLERQVIGTCFYIAPEVLDKNYNEKCDLWSCGVIMYILLKGRLPFGGNNDEQIYLNIKKGHYDLQEPPLDKVSFEAKDLISKLLVQNPNERLSAEAALQHPWFINLKIKDKLSELKTDTIRGLLHNIKNYSPDKILQQAAVAYIVHNFPQIQEVQDACKLFVKIDKNNDGSITQTEFIDGLLTIFASENEIIEKEFLDTLFNIIDADGSNFIEYEEFVRAAIDKQKFMDEKIIKFAFHFFDKDGSGEITLNEVEDIFKRNSANNFSNEDFRIIIQEVDINGDGCIDFSEFKAMMEKILK